MRWYALSVLLVVSLLVITPDSSEARKRKKKLKLKRIGCVYQISTTQEGKCDPATASQVVAYNFVKGPTDCQKTLKNKEGCIGCKYIRNKTWGPCVNGVTTKKETLRTGSKAGCPAQKTVTKKCTANVATTKTNQHGCRYKPSRWSRCRRGLKRRYLRLRKSGSHPNCHKTKTIVKRCSKNRG